MPCLFCACYSLLQFLHCGASVHLSLGSGKLLHCNLTVPLSVVENHGEHCKACFFVVVGRRNNIRKSRWRPRRARRWTGEPKSGTRFNTLKKHHEKVPQIVTYFTICFCYNLKIFDVNHPGKISFSGNQLSRKVIFPGKTHALT